MRSVILLDTKIEKDEALALLDDFGEFFEQHTGIKCEWYVERRDFSSVPTVPDNDGDLKPTKEYRKALETDVHNRYGDYGTDNIVMWVHEDNFLYKGVWGTNWSYNFFKYSFQLCRWDKDNPANTFGTLYHELMHSFDAVIKHELGVDIHPLFGNWDRSVVHGNSSEWDYIGRRTGRENTKALEMIAVNLKAAYALRKEKHLKHIGLMERIIKILSTIVALLSRKG